VAVSRSGPQSSRMPKLGLGDPTGAGDDQAALVGDPFAGELALEQCLVEAAPGVASDIFRAGAHMAQPGRAHAYHD